MGSETRIALIERERGGASTLIFETQMDADSKLGTQELRQGGALVVGQFEIRLGLANCYSE
jgi:hypothetical protein